MSYCSSSDLDKRWGTRLMLQLLDRDRDGSADSGVLTAAQEECDGIIDSYLRAVASVPLTTVPNVVRSRAEEITVYLLWVAAPPDDVQRRYDQAIAWLRDVHAGRADLGLDDAQTGGLIATVSTGSSAFDWDAY